MKSRQQREEELLSSGLVDSIKGLFQNTNATIPEKYYLLMADYIDCIGIWSKEAGIYLDPVNLARTLPNAVNTIVETNIGNIYGRTDGKQITMNPSLNYETNKLFFFHELTHAIQSKDVNNQEVCGFYNGKNGMFLTEGTTQFTAEMLYHISNGTELKYREQPNTVRGHKEHTPYSPLSEYQLNGDILMLLSGSLGIPLNHLLALGFRIDGRQLLKDMYESFPNNAGKFEEFMTDLEKIHYIDLLIIKGVANKLQGNLVDIKNEDGERFKGNIQSQGEIINKVEQDLAANFIENNTTNDILQNYQKISPFLTTPQLKQNFMNAVNTIEMLQPSPTREQPSSELRI